MTSRQEARFNVCRAVRQVCDGNTAVWTGKPSFATPYPEFTGLLDTVEAAGVRQSTSSVGTTMGKEALRHTLEGQTMHVADTLVLHFKLINNTHSQVDLMVNPSMLRRMSEPALAIAASKILSAAAGVTPATLTALGLDPAELTSASANLEAFIASIKSPRKIIAESKLGTEQIATLLDAMWEILVDDLDVAAKVLQYSNPEFYSMYKTAREIEDAPTRVRELTVHVKDDNHEGIGGVKVQITPGNINKVTTKKGTFYIQDMDGGTYTGIINAPGYKSKTVAFAIIDNQPTVVDVSLEKA